MVLGLRLVNATVMIALPLVLGAWLAHRYGLRWRLFACGAVTFVTAQVVHLPLLKGLTLLLGGLHSPALREHAGLVNAILLGLAAGVCEEGARYLGYRFLVPGARSWDAALLLGTGHGGTEAIIFGVLAGAFALHAVSSASVASPVLLLGAVERVFALANHLALSVLVLQTFLRRSWLWLLAAIGWHAVFDGVAVYWAPRIPVYTLEAILGLFALASVGMLCALRPPRAATS